jgi:L-seryl-tRNA(Ser) seleniumtransferase
MNLFRHIPSVSELLEKYSKKHPQAMAKRAIREVLQKLRQEIKEGRRKDLGDLHKLIESRIRELSSTNLKRVINATGVVINTNLGRSPLSERVAQFIKEIATNYSNLEYDLQEGKRGSRLEHVRDYILELTGAEAVHLVNNNAGAVYLVLNTLAKDRDVIVSRGELVEIGGSFRVPDIMRASGANLIEVGTTNRTRLSDYKEAITQNTALIMKVHRSNFYIEGFVQDVGVEELLSIGLSVYYDVGSGCLLDLRKYGLNVHEPTFGELIKLGVHIVSGSGDKLLGGPQAGIILGCKDYIERIRKNPMSRALRIDKLTLAGMEMTLRLYMEGCHEDIPVLSMLLQKPEDLEIKAKKLSRYLKRLKNLEVHIVREYSRCGGGALPQLSLETYCIAIKHRSMSAKELEKKLRESDPPVVARIREDRVLLDLRTMFPEDLKDIQRILKGL